MNILIVAVGSQGDVNPFIIIGMALQKRGHDVTILSNNYFRDSIQNSGLGFASVGSTEDFNKMVDEVDTTNPTRTTKVVMKYLYFDSMQKVYNTIKELYISGETIVLGITMAFGARIAQEKLDIPLIKSLDYFQTGLLNLNLTGQRKQKSQIFYSLMSRTINRCHQNLRNLLPEERHLLFLQPAQR